ncbi:MAG TPA: RNA polymerase sigma factor [Polyangiales bacterium]|nr:RNA polymerase sigma factor [Polyangiales bacterium]
MDDSYLRYGPALVRKARRLLGNHADAQDIVQGLFVDLLAESEVEPDPEAKKLALPYLYRAVTHRCLSLLRNEKNRARLLAEQTPALRGQARTRCDDEVLGLDLLSKLLRELSERESEIVVYRYFDDLSQDEIAGLVGTSRKTVGKDLDRVRDAVHALRGEGDEP